jgi:DHA1 family bicyclomycin/chloramphenicol resistance-like MFS transporter
MMKNKKLTFLLFVNLFSLTGYFTFAPLYALFARDIGTSPAWIGVIWGGYSLLTAGFILLMGKLENHVKKEAAIVAGYVIYAVGALLFLFVHDTTSLVIVLAFNSLGAGVTLPAYKTIFAASEDKGRETQEWSWLDAGSMFAAAIGSTIGGALIGLYGFRGIFIAMAGIQLSAAIVAYRYLTPQSR